MNALLGVLAAFITLLVLDIISSVQAKKKYRCKRNFVVRVGSWLWGIAAPYTAIMMVILLGLMFSGGKRDYPAVYIIMLILVAIGFFAMLLPIRGFWEVRVNHEDITVVKFWIFRRHYTFNDIDYAVEMRGEVNIYIKGKRFHKFFIDYYAEGYSNFIDCLDERSIHIRPLKERKHD